MSIVIQDGEFLAWGFCYRIIKKSTCFHGENRLNVFVFFLLFFRPCGILKVEKIKRSSGDRLLCFYTKKRQRLVKSRRHRYKYYIFQSIKL